MTLIHAILLGKDDLAQTVPAPQPVAHAPERAAEATVPPSVTARRALEGGRSHVGVFGTFRPALMDRQRLLPARAIPIEDLPHGGAERLTESHPITHRRRHAVVGEYHQIVRARARSVNCPPDLPDARIRSLEIGQRLTTRRPEMVSELVVLHERAVDDRHAEVDVEQDRHRLQLAHDDVREDPQHRKDSLGMGGASPELAYRPLPLLAQPFTNALDPHSQQPYRVHEQEEQHPRSTQPLEHRGSLSGSHGERHGLGVAVQQIHVARSARQRPRRGDAIPDILHPVRGVAGYDPPCVLVVEAEGRDSAVLAVKDSRLTIGRRRGQAAEPSPERVPFRVEQSGNRRTVALLDRAAQVGVRQRVDLQHHDSAPVIANAALPPKGEVLDRVIPTEQRPGT